MCAKKFLSTPSARRATIISSIIVLPLSISIHALREEGDIVHGIGESLSFISIHALREEGDLKKPLVCGILGVFLSTPSARRATITHRAKGCIWSFLSTPSARRATSCGHASQACKAYFYPRPPRGGRHCFDCIIIGCRLFLSTPSARRATPQLWARRSPRCISIHALREEGDDYCIILPDIEDLFLSTPSARRATTHR